MLQTKKQTLLNDFATQMENVPMQLLLLLTEGAVDISSRDALCLTWRGCPAAAG